MEILGKILGSPARVKIMRAFLLNQKNAWTSADVTNRCRVAAETARRELRTLSSAGFIKKSNKGWIFNPNFKYSREIENLLVNSDTIEKNQIIESFKKSGKIKLLIVSGVFIKNRDARVDLLVVGDRLKKSRIQEEVKKLEAEIGTELSYAMFETKEFLYRMNMYDKLVRDILDFPHEVVLEAKELNSVTGNTSKPF